MVTRKELVVRGGQPQQRYQPPQEIQLGAPYITPEGRHGVITEIGLNKDGQQTFTVSHRQQPIFVQNVIVHGDYHYTDDSRAVAAHEARKDLHQRYALAREAREDRRSSNIQAGMFASVVVIVIVVIFLGFGLAAIGMLH